MKYITDSIIKAVKWAHKETNGKLVFCGSFGLVLNGKLRREIHDIDCLTEYLYYGDPVCMDINRESSCKFWINGAAVLCVNGRAPNGIAVDFLYRKDYKSVKYKVHNFHGIKIKVELPEFAIRAKQDYVKSNSVVQKHQQDLEQMTDDLPF